MIFTWLDPSQNIQPNFSIWGWLALAFEAKWGQTQASSLAANGTGVTFKQDVTHCCYWDCCV